MKKTQNNIIELNRMRSYSSVFSSTSFSKLIKNEDLSFIDARIKTYDIEKFKSGKFETYLEYVQYIYRELSKKYRNEYIYKNTFINRMLIKKYGVKNTIAINEFKVGNSIADLVMFNGVSKAFEIKTELDSSKRLKGQIDDYRKVFNECYVITDVSLIDKYALEDETVGLIALNKTARTIKMEEIRKPVKNECIDAKVVMRCLRTPEYQMIVKKYYGSLPEMNSFNMFDICSDLIDKIPSSILSDLFIDSIKKRKSNTTMLDTFMMELRQLALAMNINSNKYRQIEEILNNPINI